MGKQTERPDEAFTLSLQEAADRVGLAPNTVSNIREAGFIEGRQFGLASKRRWWFHPDDIAWLATKYPHKRRAATVASA